MRTYRELLREREFTGLFLASSLQVTAAMVAQLALAIMVFDRTGSPLLSALSMFGPSLAQLVGASLLLSAADRVPPRLILAALPLVFGAVSAAVAFLPIWAIFTVLLVEGVVMSLGSGVRWGLLGEILPEGGYLLGRSLMNMATGGTQIVGYAVGGVLVSTLSPRVTLLVGAGLYLVAAVVARLSLSARPPRVADRPSAGVTWRTNGVLLRDPARLATYLALWVPNGLIVGCESLFVSYSPRHAALLFVATAAGMLAGDTVVIRFVPAKVRQRLAPALRLLLAVPYLCFAFHPPLPLAVAAATLASVGYSAGLLLQERLLTQTPADIHGQALGLHSTGMMAWQGIAAALAGTVAQHSTPTAGIAVMAAASTIVTLALATRLNTPAVARLQPEP